MAINSPIIVAGPTKQRGHVLDHRIQTYSGAPGEVYLDVVDGTLPSVLTPNPTREGQVYVHVQTSGNDDRFATMDVGVSVSGTLTWVVVDTFEYLNPYTGQPIDPMFP